jgi:hypothetical protein
MDGFMRTGKRKIIGICPLCRQEAELRDSHIVPLGFFEEVRRQGTPTFASAKRGVSWQMQGGMHEHMLCPTCERLLGDKYDSYAINILRNGTAGVFVYSCEEGFILEGVDVNRLKLFVLSVFWRAHHAKRVPLEKVDIGEKAEVDIRNFIRSGSAPTDRSSYPIYGVALINPHTNEIEREFMTGVSRQKRLNDENLKTFVVVFGGVAWYVLLGEDGGKDENAHLFLDSSRIFIPAVNILEFEPFRRAWNSVLMGTKRIETKNRG